MFPFGMTFCPLKGVRLSPQLSTVCPALGLPKVSVIFIPKVSREVTPSVTRAGIASGLIQKLIQDITTINPDGMYVWKRWYPSRRLKLNTTAKQVKLPK